MYIKRTAFNDIDTLIETLYDFEIGLATDTMHSIINTVDLLFADNEPLQKELQTIPTEDAMELADDWKRERIAHLLKDGYASFKVYDNKFWGVLKEKDVLLYTIDME